MPTAITDSPIATITTRPWRSTKFAGAIAKPRWQHEVTGHPAEQEEPPCARLRRDGVGHPRVAPVHPPDHTEHQDDLRERTPRRRVVQDRGQLRDREDEHEVEEE